ncbi:MAG: PAP2 family protein, partial [Odoribacter sp.]|nr:PAP2 family protein [Odoribacter sp.]
MARTLSVVLHPVLMPVYILYLLFHIPSWFLLIPAGVKGYCYLVTLFMLVLLPLACLPLLRYFHLIRDFRLEDKHDRIYPILTVVFFAFLGYWLLGRIAYTDIVQRLYLVMIILLSLFSMITLRWKISMHMTAIGGACGFLLVLGLKYSGDVRSSFMTMLVLAGLLASSRLYLKKHT